MASATEIRIYNTYKFVAGEDCGSTHHHSGGNVVVLARYDCLDCWWVRHDDGHEFWAYGDELYSEGEAV